MPICNQHCIITMRIVYANKQCLTSFHVAHIKSSPLICWQKSARWCKTCNPESEDLPYTAKYVSIFCNGAFKHGQMWVSQNTLVSHVTLVTSKSVHTQKKTRNPYYQRSTFLPNERCLYCHCAKHTMEFRCAQDQIHISK